MPFVYYAFPRKQWSYYYFQREKTANKHLLSKNCIHCRRPNHSRITNGVEQQISRDNRCQRQINTLWMELVHRERERNQIRHEERKHSFVGVESREKNWFHLISPFDYRTLIQIKSTLDSIYLLRFEFVFFVCSHLFFTWSRRCLLNIHRHTMLLWFDWFLFK